jgi:integrase/recombinase XerD
MTNGYRSPLANELQAFLEFKRSLGIQYDRAEGILRRFDRFVAQTFKGRKPIDLKIAIEGWLATFHCRPVTITNNFVVLRKFCLFLRRRDPNGFVPDRDLAPRVYESHHVPHIFSPAEIWILLDEIGKMQHPFRSRTYRALLLILYCTGLRTGEAVRLRIRDVDLRAKVFRVEVSKAKSRWCPSRRPWPGNSPTTCGNGA